MALDALLARLEGRAVTPVTADATPDVTPKPAPILACTCVTSVTAENDDTAGKATSEPIDLEAFEERAAIREFDGGINRQDAERLALTDLADDRIKCSQCKNLVGSKCAKWRELGALQGWQPVQLPLRCEQFKPKAGEPDQRTGAQRWPGLAVTIH